MVIQATRDAPTIADIDITHFQRDGAVCLRGFLESRWIDMLRENFNELKAAAFDMTDYYSDAEEGEAIKRAPRTSLLKDDNWMTSAPMKRFLFESGIAEACARVTRSSKVNIYEDLMIYKAAAPNQRTPWHQDEPQWPLTGVQLSSAWLCLESVTADTGALRFIAGSHRGPLYIPYAPAAQQHLVEQDMHFFEGGKLPDVDADPEHYRVISWDTEPGDIVIFHPRVIHAAFGSDAERPRRTFSIRFLGDDVRWQTKSSVMFPWLEANELKDGDPFGGERFPQVWAAS